MFISEAFIEWYFHGSFHLNQSIVKTLFKQFIVVYGYMHIAVYRYAYICACKISAYYNLNNMVQQTVLLQ